MDMEQTAFSLSTVRVRADSLAFNQKDTEVLRGLAAHVAEIAGTDAEEAKRKLWYRHNSLEETRPLIFCDPENGWNEIISEKELQCENSLARRWEMHLRKEIFWGGSMGDDRATEPYFNVPYVYGESDWGMHETKIGGEHGGSYKWEAPLRDYDNLSKLHFPEIAVDYQKTDEILNLASEVFDGILKVRLKMSWWWSLGMTWTLINLRGLTQVMYDMYDYPGELHKLMSFLRDGHLAKLDFLEKNNLLGLNNDGTYVGSGGFGYTSELPRKDFDGKSVRTKDMWGFCESQETSQISPEMFEEFVFPYQMPIMEQFGLNCYGCCEPLDRRWHVVKKFPRLRRVSVSPWSDPVKMAEMLGNKYIYSMKPNPAHLAVPVIDEDFIRRNLREVLKITGNCRLEVIMKDNNTIGNNPQNVIRWCKIAREEAESL